MNKVSSVIPSVWLNLFCFIHEIRGQLDKRRVEYSWKGLWWGINHVNYYKHSISQYFLSTCYNLSFALRTSHLLILTLIFTIALQISAWTGNWGTGRVCRAQGHTWLSLIQTQLVWFPCLTAGYSALWTDWLTVLSALTLSGLGSSICLH